MSKHARRHATDDQRFGTAKRSRRLPGTAGKRKHAEASRFPKRSKGNLEEAKIPGRRGNPGSAEGAEGISDETAHQSLSRHLVSNGAAVRDLSGFCGKRYLTGELRHLPDASRPVVQ